MKRQLIIVYGGRSCEHDISIITALYVYNALNLKSHNKLLVYFHEGSFYVGKDLANIETYVDFKPSKFNKVIFCNGNLYKISKKLVKFCKVDCALLCTHGGEGENGALQGFFEVNDIAYTSANVAASSLTMDKVLTKKMLEILGYKSLPYVTLGKDNASSAIKEFTKKWGFPIIAKPSKLGSSIGISVARNQKQAIDAIGLGFRFDDKLLIEKCLEDFIEINCAAIRNGEEILVSLPEKLSFDSDYLSYDDKYMCNMKLPNNREYPAKIDDKLISKIQELTRQIYVDFNLSGVVRVDYLLKNNEIYVNEINTIPGSLSYYLFSKLDINISQLVDILIKQSHKERLQKSSLVNSFSSQVLSHYKRNKETLKMK